MITAYQIVDFNNPISLEYSKHSLLSFTPALDSINIIPVQCTTPNTLPNININPKYKRTPTEKAVLFSHYNLIKRIANGEKCIIMEHDAYLWPDKVEVFKQQLEMIDDVSLWSCGVAIECYTLSKDTAAEFCDIIENHLYDYHPGPMYLIHLAGDRGCKKENKQALWPLKGNTNKVCLGSSSTQSLNGNGLVFDAPVTQHVMQSVGVTIEKSNNWKYTPQNNKNLYFT